MNLVSGTASVQYGTCARCVKLQRRDRKACVGREAGQLLKDGAYCAFVGCVAACCSTLVLNVDRGSLSGLQTNILCPNFEGRIDDHHKST
eukprot:6199462-Pleurochrysis_carterae.AAC.1